MRIVFMGTPDFAVPSLEALLQSSHTVVGVVTQPDRPKGRGQAVVMSPIKLVCVRAGIPVLQPLKMKDPEFLAALQAWKPDLIAVTAFGRILPKVILDLPPQGCVNVHGSLLPKYRGAGPIQWAVINGETETGITTMLMDERMDTGMMLLQESVLIAPDDTAGTVSSKLAGIGGRLLVETIERLMAGTITPQAQDSSQATMAPLLKKEDGLIDWSKSAVQLANRIRGVTPWPGGYSFLQGERWIFWQAKVVEGDSQAALPGTVVQVTKHTLVVSTGQGLLAISEIQPANSRRMAVPAYLAGHPIAEGTRFDAKPPPGALSDS
jgi:methionyl-tRNA formyltransferase